MTVAARMAAIMSGDFQFRSLIMLFLSMVELRQLNQIATAGDDLLWRLISQGGFEDPFTI
jgi:hypothetical protein